MTVDQLRSREAALLLKHERRAQALQRQHADWNWSKCYCEAWITSPKLYEEYQEIRQMLSDRKVRPIIPPEGKW
jgi:hypothetical protein